MIYKQIAVRLPRLLDKDLHEVGRLRPSAQSISLNITPLSTASLTVDDKSGIAIRSFVELYNAKGSAGIYRVNLPEESYGSGGRISLEHGICVLDDAIVPGQGKIKGTPRAVLERILARQTTMARGMPLWTLGDVEALEEIEVEHDGTKGLEMLLRVLDELPDYMLAFDQSALPWVLHVRRKPEHVACEGRLSRNIRTIRKTMDDTDLRTRLYCSLLDGGYIESDTVSAWGVVEQEVTLNDDTPKADALAFCRRYLENRKNPAMAIEMDAIEWYKMTGERLDRFETGDICRLALPEYGAVIEQRIVAMNYADALGQPEMVTVSIANQMADMSIKSAEMDREINSLKSKSTGYGNALRQTNEVIQHLKEEDEGIKQVNNKFVKWFAAAQIDLDATEEGADVGILATYQETYDLFSDVDKRVTSAELILHGDGESATAGLVARMEEAEADILTGAEDVRVLSESYSVFKATQEEATAALVAKAGENEAAIIATANNLGSRIDLKADKTYVDDLVAKEIEAAIADIGLSIGETVVTKYLTVTDRATLSAMALGGQNVIKTTLPIVTEFVQALGASAPTRQVTLLTVA